MRCGVGGQSDARTLGPGHYTLDPKPRTMHLALYIRHGTSCTLRPQSTARTVP